MKSRITLVVLSCVISIIIGLVVARGSGRTGGVTEKRKLLIGFSMDTLKESRWQADRDFFVKRAGELGADVLVQAANSDDARQIQDVQALISRRVDVLVVVPHNGAAMAKGVKLAHEAGIPVISYDRLTTDCDLDLYITFDNVRVGELQAQFVVEHAAKDRPMRIVRIYGAKTDNNARLFKQGQDRIFDPLIKDGKIVVVHEDWTDEWRPENAKKIMNAAITKVGATFDAVVAANDGTAGGAIQALTEEGLAGKVLVTGQDAELAACQRIVNGTQAMTIYKPISKLAPAAVEAAIKMAKGKPVIALAGIDNGQVRVPTILLDVVPVTKDNMAQTVAKDGFQSFDEVYRGVRAELLPQKP
jgi:D-xylose transport system substrate-binding protein